MKNSTLIGTKQLKRRLIFTIHAECDGKTYDDVFLRIKVINMRGQAQFSSRSCPARDNDFFKFYFISRYGFPVFGNEVIALIMTS